MPHCGAASCCTGEMNLAMDKRNVYDFDIRIHLVVAGPGIRPGSVVKQLATNVDLTPTWWGLAGIEFGPEDTDGRSLVPLLVTPPAPGGQEPVLPASVTAHLETAPTAAEAAAGWRETAFIEYYYVGIGPKCGQAHPIEAIDNNFIAIRYVDHPLHGDSMYAEYEPGDGGAANWTHPTHFEYYQMDTDPWQLENKYANTNLTLRAELHQTVQAWLHCRGASCP